MPRCVCRWGWVELGGWNVWCWQVRRLEGAVLWPCGLYRQCKKVGKIRYQIMVDYLTHYCWPVMTLRWKWHTLRDLCSLEIIIISGTIKLIRTEKIWKSAWTVQFIFINITMTKVFYTFIGEILLFCLNAVNLWRRDIKWDSKQWDGFFETYFIWD